MAVRAYWKGSLGCCCRHCEERLVRRSSTSEGGSDEAMHAFSIQCSNSHDSLDAVIPGWSAGPDPESRDSGFDASHRPGMTNSGLLRRFASRNDVASNSKHTFAASPRNAPEVLHLISRPKRAWGTPDARCTRGLVCT